MTYLTLELLESSFHTFMRDAMLLIVAFGKHLCKHIMLN